MRPTVVEDDIAMFPATGAYPNGQAYRQLELKNYFIDLVVDGPVLVVTFEGAGGPLERPNGQRPGWSQPFLSKHGYSMLAVKPKQLNWYRKTDLHDWITSPDVAKLLKRFDRVIFAGTSMGGYAAVAFSAIFPGCDVISFNPQATLSQDVAAWDKRFPAGSFQDWSGRFSDAADSVPLCRRLFVCYDPHDAPDAWHAKHLDGPNVIHLTTPYVGHAIPMYLLDMKILSDVMLGCLTGTITEAEHWKLSRARRTIPRFYEQLFIHARTDSRKRFVLQYAIEKNIVSSGILSKALGFYKAPKDIGKRAELVEIAKGFVPKTMDDQRILSDFLVSSGEYDLGIRMARSIAEKSPKDYSLQHNLGKVLMKAKRYALAVDPLSRSAAMHPMSYRIWVDLAEALSRVGKFDEADDAVSNAARAGLGKSAELQLRATLHLRIARVMLNKSIEIDGGSKVTVEKLRALRSLT